MLTAIVSNLSEVSQINAKLAIDWNEVILLLIGAAIGLISSLATTIIQKHLDQKGKMNIFYKFIHSKGSNNHSWGFTNTNDGRIYFSVPVVFEFQNTSNTTRVIRDVSILLFRENKFIARMLQIEYGMTTSRENGVVTKETKFYYGSENGSYSFVLAPRSIQKQECHYTLTIPVSKIEEMAFTQIVIRYHDENNKAHYFHAKDIFVSWEPKYFDADREWILLNDKRKYSENDG